MSLVHITLGCLLALLPGPPGIYFEDGYLQLFPIDPTKCKGYDVGRDITFELYTKHNPLSPQRLRVDDDNALQNSYMDFSLPTVMYFHAFFESANSTSGTILRHAYLLRGDHNVIMVSSIRYLPGPWYLTAVRNTLVIGLHAGRFINYLYDKGLHPKGLHLIGLSLGAQSAGVAGGSLRTKPARITGLDPALPLFDNAPLTNQLDKSDADFVDIIHTDGGIFGIASAMGHADFYVNGGISPQPGCELKTVLSQPMVLEKVFCSHWRSYLVYAQSVINPTAFPSIPCGPGHFSCRKLRNSRIIKMQNTPTFMGHGADPEVHGKFYVQTSSSPPYIAY